MKISINSAILCAMTSSVYGRAVTQVSVDRRSTEGIKYRTYQYIGTGDVPEGVQTYDLPKYLSNECILHSVDSIVRLVIDEVPTLSPGQVGCEKWWVANDCATGYVETFDLPLSKERVSDVVFSSNFRTTAGSFKLTDGPCPSM